jgi:hypothetical protein
MNNQQIFNDFTNFMNLFKNDDLNNNIKIIEDNGKHELESADKNVHKQVKKLRCSICKVKINAVDAIISSCKCDKNHCLKHRMPESHNCSKLNEISEAQKKNLKASLIKVDSCKVSLI